MAISNFLHRIMPKGSNPRGAVNTGRKKLQILSSLKAAFIGLGRRLRVVNTDRKLVGNALGRHLPEIPLSARFGVEAKLANIMSGHAFDASSSTGIELSSRAAKVVRDLTPEDGVYFTTEERKDELDENPDDAKLRLVSIGKKALKDRRTAMVKARNEVNHKREQIFKAEKSKKKGWEEKVVDLKTDLDGMEQQQKETRADYMALRQAAVELKIAEIKEQYNDSESASILEELEAQLATMKASVFGDAAVAVRSSTTKKWETQIELRQSVGQVPRELRRMVYSDVKDYLVSDENYLKMLDAQSKHQMIDGTEQLHYIPGANRRLPGLPYYMAKAKAASTAKNEIGVTKEMHLIEAARMMEEDWGSFLEVVQDEMNDIMKPEGEDVEGEFDHSRMWDYFNMTAYMETLKWTKELQADPDTRYEILTDFGDVIGTRRPYRYITQAEWDKRQSLKIAQDYNLTVGKEAQGTMFPSVRYVSGQERVTLVDDDTDSTISKPPPYAESDDLIMKLDTQLYPPSNVTHPTPLVSPVVDGESKPVPLEEEFTKEPEPGVVTQTGQSLDLTKLYSQGYNPLGSQTRGASFSAGDHPELHSLPLREQTRPTTQTKENDRSRSHSELNDPFNELNPFNENGFKPRKK